MLDFNSLCSGVIGAILGAVVSYWLQNRLVAKQIAAAEKTQAEYMSVLKDARHYFGERSKQIASSLGNIDYHFKQLSAGR